MCQQIGDTPELMPVLRTLLGFYVNTDLPAGLEVAQQMFSVAQGQQDPVFYAEAHYALALAYFFLGDFVASS